MTGPGPEGCDLLTEAQWRARAAAHRSRVLPWVQPWLDRRARGTSHPVDDFLFTYYSHRPAQLLRWHPGAGVTCEIGGHGRPVPFGDGYVATSAGVRLEPALFVGRLRQARWVHELLRRTSARPASLACLGLHEWAMVYRQEPGEVRHASWPLRIDPVQIAATVETLGPRCTHFDAFRFFTEPARPLNRRMLTRADQLDAEQPGCLHATMDLYKWAYQLSPLVDSELVADCFALARDVRTVDMQASPYDLGDLGVTPIAIETGHGRAEYVEHQREFVARAAPLRRRLLDRVDDIVRRLTAASDVLAS